jgi:small subunit ribosomal protein S2
VEALFPGCGGGLGTRLTPPVWETENNKRSAAMAAVTIRQLLDSGVHFGHQTRRWNPKVKRFILTERSGIHIIDLQQSLAYIDQAYAFLKETVAKGGTVLFVGTKKQAQEAISEQALRVGQPYVNERWLGGLLTNFQTVSKRLGRMKELEEVDYEDTTQGFTKKELLMKKRELTKLQKSLGGIRTLTKAPDAIWVIDPLREHLAIDEAKKLRIPIVGILDSNADPDDFHYPIPGNDDAIRSVALLTKLMADAVAEGLIERHQKPEAEGNVSAVEPLAEWERELLEQSGDPAPAPAVVAETPVAEPTADAPEEDAPAVKKPAAKAPAKKPAAAKKEPAVKKEPAAEKEPAKAAAKAPAKKPAAEKKPATKAPAAKTEKK